LTGRKKNKMDITTDSMKRGDRKEKSKSGTGEYMDGRSMVDVE